MKFIVEEFYKIDVITYIIKLDKDLAHYRVSEYAVFKQPLIGMYLSPDPNSPVYFQVIEEIGEIIKVSLVHKGHYPVKETPKELLTIGHVATEFWQQPKLVREYQKLSYGTRK